MFGQGVIPDDWESGEYCRFSVCWPNSPMWLAVLRGVLIMPAQGRFWDKNTGTITSAQEVIRETFDQNLHLEEVIMSCGDGALTEIASALRMLAITQQQLVTVQANCCSSGSGGSAGSGSVTPPFNPAEQGNPSTTPPPDGFDTWEQFFANKCAVATDIVSTLRGDVSRMGTINFVGLTVLGALPALLTLLLDPIPGDEIFLLIGILIAAANEGRSILAIMDDVLGDNDDALICELFSSTSAADAESRFEAAFNGFVDDAGGVDPVANWEAKFAMSHMVTSAITNRLFTLETVKTLPAGDCSGCACELAFLDGLGTGDLFPDGEIRTITAVLSGGFYQILFAGDCGCSNGWQVEVVSVDGYIIHNFSGPGTGDGGGLIQDCSEATLWRYDDAVAPTGTWCGGYFCLGSIAEGPWSADVRISQGCL